MKGLSHRVFKLSNVLFEFTLVSTSEPVQGEFYNITI